jgi:hypothetical protein
MGHDCCWVKPKGSQVDFNDDTFYISYNFGKFSDYWHISEAHGHSGKTILHQLEKVLFKLTQEGVTPKLENGQDGWSASKNVFMLHLVRLKTQCSKHLKDHLYSDCLMDQKPIPYVDEWGSDGGCKSDGEEEPQPLTIDMGGYGCDMPLPDEPDKYPGLVSVCGKFSVMHPIEGCISVDTYDRAMGCYGRALEAKEFQRAESWKKLASTLPGAPK